MDYVRISAVVACHSCPVRYYLEKNMRSGTERVEYTIAKQISYHLGKDFCDDEVWEEIRLINPTVGDDIYPLYLEWVQNCRNNSWPIPEDTDIEVRSKKLGIIGRIDNLFQSEPKVGIIRAGRAPETGVYRSDRIRSALVSICATETLGIEIEEIILQYIPDGISKVCRPSPADRRAALRALSYAKKIERGYIPEKRSILSCNNCYLKDYCITGPKTISEFL